MTTQSPAATRSRFKPATREQAKLRMGIDGPSGSGKTYTALRLAFQFGQRVAVIDSENGSASLYAGDQVDGIAWNFDATGLTNYAPTTYTAAIEDAAQGGYDVLVIDSLSHAWEGADGALELVSKKGGNSYTAWKDVTPLHRRMVEAILRFPGHVICTMRSKTEYVIEEDSNGKKVPRKIGMAPIQRPGMEYEFTVYGSMDWSHILTITKSRCQALDGLVVVKPGPEVAKPLLAWLEKGVTAAPVEFTPTIVGADQLARIVGLIARLGRDLEKEKKALLKRYSVTEFGQLSVDAARNYEALLNAELAKSKKGASANGHAATQPAPSQDSASQPAGEPAQTLQEALAAQPGPQVITQDADPNGKGDFLLLQKLAAAREIFFDALGLGNLPEHKAARTKLWEALLKQWGVPTAAALTNAVIAEKTTKLYANAEEIRRQRLADAEKK